MKGITHSSPHHTPFLHPPHSLQFYVKGTFEMIYLAVSMAVEHATPPRRPSFRVLGTLPTNFSPLGIIFCLIPMCSLHRYDHECDVVYCAKDLTDGSD